MIIILSIKNSIFVKELKKPRHHWVGDKKFLNTLYGQQYNTWGVILKQEAKSRNETHIPNQILEFWKILTSFGTQAC